MTRGVLRICKANNGRVSASKCKHRKDGTAAPCIWVNAATCESPQTACFSQNILNIGFTCVTIEYAVATSLRRRFLPAHTPLSRPDVQVVLQKPRARLTQHPTSDVLTMSRGSQCMSSQLPACKCCYDLPCNGYNATLQQSVNLIQFVWPLISSGTAASQSPRLVHACM